ncbi:MAG: FkbM family methyltransferase [Deltaproteobacteria bacterium]|nr:FkbM family methyltransferase [Deltaproteobacteria bacterium]
MRKLRVRGLPRLMFSISRLMFGSGVINVQLTSGFKLLIDPGDYFGCMMLCSRYAPEILTLMQRLVRHGDSVIDVGAQLGFITGHLALLVGPSGSCASFEPDPNAVARLTWMVHENGFNWVRIFPLAAGDADGEIPFLVSPILGWSTAVSGSHLKNLSQIQVRVRRIDDIAAAGGIRRPVKFIKIDVEGFECAVLDGMESLINEDRPTVVLEINPRMLAARGDNSVKLLKRLFCQNYEVHRIHEQRGLFQGGVVRLDKVEEATDLGSCDVLCFPREIHLPDGLA